MFAEVASLYAVLALLYLLESLVAVRSGRPLVARWWPARFRLLEAERLPGRANVGIALLAPWVWGEAFRCGGSGDKPASLDPRRGPTALAPRIAKYRAATRALRSACFLQAVLLLAVLPLVVAWRGLASTWKPLLLAMLALHALILVLLYRAHRQLDPEAGRARWGLLARLAVSPPAALRAADLLSLPLLQLEHPLAVAVALRVERELPRLARHASFEGRVDVEKQPAKLTLRRWGLDPDQLLAPPTRENPNCRVYCPRCHAQYTDDRLLVCRDCPDIRCVPFAG